MILAIEIDNSRINFGFFEKDGTLVKSFKIATDITKTLDEYAVLIDGIFEYHKINRDDISGAAICSVVPMLTTVIYDLMKQLFCNIEIVKVQKGIKTGFSIKVDTPAELGADLVANAVAISAIKNNGGTNNNPCVIVDIGNATTIFALNANNEFIGGSILPGVEMSFNALHGNTALLPNVAITRPEKAIGKNSQDSICSGVLMGTAILIDGFIKRFSDEMKAKSINVFVTGEYAEFVMDFCSTSYQYIPNLTLLGLYYVYKNNTVER